MKKRIFVTATNTDIGKSYTTKLLLKEYASQGFRVGVIKLIETGVIDDNPLDGKLLLDCVQKLNDKFLPLTTSDIVPITYELPSAPIVASNNKKLDFKKLDLSISKLEKLCDLLIIEGAGGLLVPVDENTMMVDLISYFNATALLVTHCSLGCINDTLLSKKVLEDRDIPHKVVFNCRDNDEDFEKVSKPYFDIINFDILKVKHDIEKITSSL